MEVRQRTELTGTNRSCGLTTYFSQRWSLQELCRRRIELCWTWRSGNSDAVTAVRVAPGEGQSHQQSRTQLKTMLVIVSYKVERSHSSSACLIKSLASRPAELRTSSLFFPGGYTEEVTPVPIPNTEVKLFRADGTVGATLWESRMLPGF